VFVVTNSLRLRGFRPLSTPGHEPQAVAASRPARPTATVDA
jgi:hypothetical protein